VGIAATEQAACIVIGHLKLTEQAMHDRQTITPTKPRNGPTDTGWHVNRMEIAAVLRSTVHFQPIDRRRRHGSRSTESCPRNR
jgi:hypothetical protein